MTEETELSSLNPKFNQGLRLPTVAFKSSKVDSLVIEAEIQPRYTEYSHVRTNEKC